ncbi:MAG: LysM peptidoglycan-binding domain-containing protein [Acidimicrobiia bacterium]|nr:LysM peptidoglycan-binding domain-containing protein [Acidimicrobiia bacterium]
MTTIASARIRALSIISITVVIILMLLASAVQATPDPTETTEYRVRGGDTLWQIAAEYGPSGMDRRDVVQIIQRINDLDSDTLQIGQLLEIPVVP